MTELTIGELARATGVGVETIRFYQRRKLVAEPRRPASGYRKYDDEAARRIRFIRQAQDLGFSLKEIRDLLTLRIDPKVSCADVKARAESKIAEVDRKIATLRRIRRALGGITESCAGSGPTSDCPILEAIENPRR